MDEPEDRIAVIGAGFAGLSAAVRLAAAGRKIVLVEATRHGGGRARSFGDRRSGLELDNGRSTSSATWR
jgi:phytoene dehydrogenase-like protein